MWLSRVSPVYYGSKSLNECQMKYGAPKLEMYAAVTFVKKFHSFLALRKFILRVDNQALSYSMDENLIGRWLVVLDQYDFGVEHRPRHKHTNADGMSKRSNYYRLKEELLSRQPEVRAGFNFMDQETYDSLPTAPWLDKHGLEIPDHPRLCNKGSLAD